MLIIIQTKEENIQRTNIANEFLENGQCSSLKRVMEKGFMVSY